MIETQYITRGRDTIYRVRPNPDGAACDGSDGVVVEWSDDGGKKWDGYFMIAADQVVDVARSMLLLATGKAE